MKVAGCVFRVKFIQQYLAAKNIGNDIPITQSVIQTTEGRKNLEGIHVYIFLYVLEILRFALNDK